MENSKQKTTDNYWQTFTQNSGNLIVYYRVKGINYKSLSLGSDRTAVSGFLEAEQYTPSEFYGSILALYLARINRRQGTILRTGILSEAPEQKEKYALLRIDIQGDLSFRDVISQYRTGLDAAAEHAVAEGEDCQEVKASYYGVYDLSVSGKTAQDYDDEELALTLLISEAGVEIRYHADLFSKQYMEHLVKNLEQLILSAIRIPDLPIAELEYLSEEERELISGFSKGKQLEIDRNLFLATSFRQQAIAYPENIAVDDGVSRVTYAELEKLSNSVADDLVKNHGIGRGIRVGVMLPRSWHYIETILALNKAGATYIPLDSRFPEIRIRQMMMGAGAKCLLTTRALAEALDPGVEKIYIEDLDRSRDVEMEILSTLDDLMAIIFTSGTTGMPKGVMIRNSQIPWAISAVKDTLQFTPGDTMAAYFSFAAIAAIFDLMPFAAGGTSRLINEEEQKNSLKLLNVFRENHIRSVFLPPSVGIPIYDMEDLKLDYLLVGGAKLDAFGRKKRHTKLMNIYGTTEIMFAISKIYTQEEINSGRITLGRPAANGRAYILDADNHPMPVGVPGEICISGGQISSGYFHDPELTARSFVENPLSDNDTTQIMYRTGDIGYYTFDGEIAIIGREDDQLAVRGFRIESGEILKIMKGFPELTDIYLDVENDNLVAYYVASGDPDIDRIKEAIQNQLPYYMLPSLFVRMESIPLNMNGKIDRAKLRREARSEDTVITDEVIRAVIDAFKEVLKQDVVLPNDEFVALGGNSLSAMKLQLALKEKLDVSLSSNELIGLSTPMDVANYIKTSYHVHSAIDEDRYSFDASCPLSESQLNVYLDETAHDMGTAYNNPFKARFTDTAKVTPEKLEKALGDLTRAFPVLKARVVSEDDTLSMVFDAEPEMSRGTKEDMAAFVRPFDPGRTLARFLVVAEEDATSLCADFHHLIFDGTSVNVLLKSLFSLLNGGEELPVDKGVLREASFEQLMLTDKQEEAEEFYDRMLADSDEVCGLTPSIDGGESINEYMDTFSVDMEALGEFLRSRSITHNQFFAGIFAYTLSRFSGSEKVLFNLIEDGRGHLDLSGAVGMFVKTLPVLVDCGDQEVQSFLKTTAGLINSVMKYDMYPFRKLAKRYDLESNILFEYAHSIYEEAMKQEGLSYEIEEMRHDLNADLAFNILNSGDGRLSVRILYTSLYSRELMAAFAESYKLILREMMRAEKLGEIRYISDRNTRILDGFNQTETPIPGGDILERFNENLKKYPDNRLVENQGRTYTFAEGAYIAGEIRKKLMELGVKAEDRVSFLVPRSELYVFSVLGIVSLGATYVPLDDKHPDSRLGFILRDTESKVLIATDETMERAEKLKAQEQADIAFLNLSDIMKSPIGRLQQLPVTTGKLASILYTSGSTGHPKGVRVTRRSLSFFIDAHVKIAEILPGDVVGLFAAVGFDVAMEDIFGVLYSGACLCIIPDEVKLDIPALNDYFISHGVTHADITTPIAKQIISQVKETSLKALLTGGDKLGQVTEAGNYRVIDTYGPTETCVYITHIDLRDKADPCSVGHILDNSKAYVLDREMRRVPIGAVGELHLCGPQLADGYLNREEETARVFKKNPYDDRPDYDRLYATGDVARVLPDGTYDIIGRRDGQVKIRGNRVELSAVEHLIREMDQVKDVTVQVQHSEGNKEIVAYVVSDIPEGEALEKAVQEQLCGKVPGYMVPAFVVKMDQIPYTVNGKVDRRALPAVDLGLLHAEYVAPESKLEQLIVKGFERVLHQERIGVNDDFIRLGGDSLTAVMLLSDLREYGITAGDILSLRTPAAIATAAKKNEFNLDVYTVEGGCPLTATQQYIYNDIINNEKFDVYLIPSLIKLPGKYSDDQIIDAIKKINHAHPVLTTHVEKRNGENWLVQGEMPEVMKGSVNIISVVSRMTAEFDFHQYMTRHMIVRVFGKKYLVSMFHHLIFDFISDNQFRKELLACLEGQEPQGVDDYYLKVSAFNQQVRGTREFEETTKETRALYDKITSFGFLKNPGKPGKPGYVYRELDVNTELMNSFIESLGTNHNILFTAVMSCTLSKMIGKEDVMYAFLDNGRSMFNNYDSIGLYINTLPIIAHVGKTSVSTFLEEFSQNYYALLRKNFYPFAPLAQEYGFGPIIGFQYLPGWLIGEGGYNKLPIGKKALNFALSRMSNFVAEGIFEVVENEGSYALRMYYSGYYSRQMMKAFAENYHKILTEFIRLKPSSGMEELFSRV